MRVKGRLSESLYRRCCIVSGNFAYMDIYSYMITHICFFMGIYQDPNIHLHPF